MNPKRTLHEIAAMPFPESIKAMRQHYQKDWGKPLPEGVTEKKTFEVTVHFEVTYEDCEIVTVEAWSEEEAEEIAEEKVCKDAEKDILCSGFPDISPTKSKVRLIEESVQ